MKMLIDYATKEEKEALSKAKKKLRHVYRCGTSMEIMAEESRMNNFRQELFATLMHRAKGGASECVC